MKSLITLVVLGAVSAFVHNASCDWIGTLKVGGTELRLVFHLTKGGDGRLLRCGKELRLRIQESFQSTVTGAADRQSSSIAQNHHVSIFAIRFESSHALKVHDIGTMDADEASGIESRL